jgi:hypothetical protein
MRRFCAAALFFLLCLSFQACSGQQPSGNVSPPTPSTPKAGTAAAPSYEGYIDVVDCNAVMAWGWEMSRPNDPIKLDIYDGAALIATVNADAFRQDLVTAGKGNGKHSIYWPTSVQLKDGKKHVIAVKFAGTAIDIGRPKEITCNFDR